MQLQQKNLDEIYLLFENIIIVLTRKMHLLLT